VDSVYYICSPGVCTDIVNAKWSVKGSGVSVKNGVITAKSVSKKNKDGTYKPARVMLKCRNVTLNIDVYVVE
jgi:hypothetical protein